MKTSELKAQLERHPDSELCFVLPDGGRIPVHAHITEAGRVDTTFIDCGGTVRKVSTATLQAWVAEDLDHRLPPGNSPASWTLRRRSSMATTLIWKSSTRTASFPNFR